MGLLVLCSHWKISVQYGAECVSVPVFSEADISIAFSSFTSSCFVLWGYGDNHFQLFRKAFFLMVLQFCPWFVLTALHSCLVLWNNPLMIVFPWHHTSLWTWPQPQCFQSMHGFVRVLIECLNRWPIFEPPPKKKMSCYAVFDCNNRGMVGGTKSPFCRLTALILNHD